jgi:hypothetical protein
VELLWGVEQENSRGEVPWIVVEDGEQVYGCMELLFVESKVNVVFIGSLRPKRFVKKIDGILPEAAQQF